MRVLHFITSLKVGGAEVALCNLLEYWYTQDKQDRDKKSNNKKSSVEHIVAYIYDGPCRVRIEKLGIKTYQIKGLLFPYDGVGFYRFIKLLKQVKPDVIHSALWSANIMARIGVLFYKTPPAGGFNPLICDLHGDCAHHGTIRNLFERLTLSIPTYIVPVSYSIARSFQKLFDQTAGGFNPQKKLKEKIVVIQNGIDAQALQDKAAQDPLTRGAVPPRGVLGFGESDFIVGTVGRLHKVKRYDFLLKVFAGFVKQVGKRERKPKLCLVGDGPERANLEALVKKLGLHNNVFFAGARDDVYRFYPLFDCFVLSSQTEGLSIALLEALCFGLPVVTTCEKKEHDVITHSINGLLVSVTDEKDFIRALKIIYTDENLRVSMSRANRALVQEKFTIRHVAKNFFKLYKKIVGS